MINPKTQGDTAKCEGNWFALCLCGRDKKAGGRI